MPFRPWLALNLICAAISVGCSTPGVLKPTPSREAASKPARRHADPAYRVAAGDTVEIRRRGAKLEAAEVRTDGSLQLAGASIRVDDLTPEEISCRIQERLGDAYRDCKVMVAKYNSQYVYLYGDSADESPRAVPFQGRETLQDFIIRVGCRECLRGYRARVVRPNPDMGAKPDVFAVKLDAKLNDRDPGAEPLTLKANDNVYLERDGIGPGGLLPRGSKFWPMTKFTFWNWRKSGGRDQGPGVNKQTRDQYAER